MKNRISVHSPQIDRKEPQRFPQIELEITNNLPIGVGVKSIEETPVETVTYIEVIEGIDYDLWAYRFDRFVHACMKFIGWSIRMFFKYGWKLVVLVFNLIITFLYLMYVCMRTLLTSESKAVQEYDNDYQYHYYPKHRGKKDCPAKTVQNNVHGQNVQINNSNVQIINNYQK